MTPGFPASIWMVPIYSHNFWSSTMKYHSTRSGKNRVSLSEAIEKGLAEDGGLFVPEKFPAPDWSAISNWNDFPSVAIASLRPFFEGDLLESELEDICRSAFNFPIPLNLITDRVAFLELFHGPTAAFKDVGARFLAECLVRIRKNAKKELTIAVATSGDTGGAVAAAFFGKPGIRVKVLFPKGRVSARQEKQLTCWGGNIESYAVRGTFDDCQKLVKEAFNYPEISEKTDLSSANSINIARLLPQMTYYIYASFLYEKLTGVKPVVIIPTGNAGNSAGAFWAQKSGAPIRKIVLAVNSNRPIPDFLETGNWSPRPGIQTLANAMDVGNPSNMERIRHLFPDIEQLRAAFSSYSVSDPEIRETIREAWKMSSERVCPHTAVGEFVRKQVFPDEFCIVVSTAHPAKFETIVEAETGSPVPVPPSLGDLLNRESSVQEVDPDLSAIF